MLVRSSSNAASKNSSLNASRTILYRTPVGRRGLAIIDLLPSGPLNLSGPEQGRPLLDVLIEE